MRIYIAAPYDHRRSAQLVAEDLEMEGYEIARAWWEYECGDEEVDILREQAIEDIRAVENSDAVVVLQLDKSEGKAVETGVAITLGIPVIAVVYQLPGNIFQHHPGVLMVRNHQEMFGALQALRAFDEETCWLGEGDA